MAKNVYKINIKPGTFVDVLFRARNEEQARGKAYEYFMDWFMASDLHVEGPINEKDYYDKEIHE